MRCNAMIATNLRFYSKQRKVQAGYDISQSHWWKTDVSE